eukprot:11638069-Heterocapsa_arctica.AAC.1
MPGEAEVGLADVLADTGWRRRALGVGGREAPGAALHRASSRPRRRCCSAAHGSNGPSVRSI